MCSRLAFGLTLLGALACNQSGSSSNESPSEKAAPSATPAAKAAPEPAPVTDCGKVTKCCDAIQKANLAPGILKGCQGMMTGDNCKKYMAFVNGPIKTSKPAEYASMPAECHW